MGNILYHKGQLVGNNNIVFIKETYSKTNNQGKRLRYALFQCHCGKQFERRIRYIVMGGTKSCGCKTIEYLRIKSTKHGMYRTPVYNAWFNIKERIGNKKNPGYKDYGGRGITMFPPWQVDFQLFYDYVSALPNYGVKKHSIDRINNNGNYEPGNLRWVTEHIQHTNTRKREDNKSGYTGISLDQSRNKWFSVIGGKPLGRFKTKEQAVTARNNYIIENKLFEYKIQPILSE